MHHTISGDKKSLRILIVDDVEMNLKVLKAIFVKEGIVNVDCATSGREALGLLRAKDYDFVFTDVWMPEMSGREFAIEIRTSEKLKDVPIIAVTADVDTNNFNGDKIFNDVLLKPITSDKISEIIRKFSV